MGAVLAKIYFKDGYEDVKCPEESIWNLRSLDIDEQEVTMGDYLEGSTTAVLFVNVATK